MDLHQVFFFAKLIVSNNDDDKKMDSSIHITLTTVNIDALNSTFCHIFSDKFASICSKDKMFDMNRKNND